MIIFDTNIVIGLIHQEIELKNLLKQLPINAHIGLTSPSIYELYFGYYNLINNKKGKKSKDFIETELKSIEKIQKVFHLISFTADAAKKSAELYHILSKNGEKIEPLDCMIAGTMLAAGEVDIVTNNKEHFSRIPDLNVISL